jgi:hypothetical protein
VFRNSKVHTKIAYLKYIVQRKTHFSQPLFFLFNLTVLSRIRRITDRSSEEISGYDIQTLLQIHTTHDDDEYTVKELILLKSLFSVITKIWRSQKVVRWFFSSLFLSCVFSLTTCFLVLLLSIGFQFGPSKTKTLSCFNYKEFTCSHYVISNSFVFKKSSRLEEPQTGKYSGN